MSTLSVAVLAMAANPTAAQTVKHPLDGLTAPEVWTAYETLQASGKVDAKTRYPLIQLKEPPKEEVLAWKPGQAMRREALIVVKQGAQTFEAVVDVNGKRLVSWTEIKGVQPNTFDEEDEAIDKPVKENAEVQAALKQRGPRATGPFVPDKRSSLLCGPALQGAPIPAVVLVTALCSHEPTPSARRAL